MNNAQKQQHQAFSVKDHVNNRPVAGRGIGAFQLPENVRLFKFREAGAVRIDIVPYRLSKPHLHPHAINDLWYERTYYVHKNIGLDNTTVLCPKMTFGKPCPICEYKNTLDYSDAEDLKRIKELNAQERQLFNVILPQDMRNGTPKVYLFDQPRYGFGRLIDEIVKNADEDDDHYQYYVDLEKGSTLKLNIQEMSIQKQKYFGVSSIEFKARNYTYDESILDAAIDLDTVLRITSYNDLKDMFFERDKEPATKDNEDEDSNWSRAQRLKKESLAEDSAPTTKKKSESVVDDEDEDEDNSPPVKPKKKVVEEETETAAVKKKPKPQIDDDEDEDNSPPAKPKPKQKPVVDDDDEDEDNSPPVKSKTKQKPVVDDDDEDEDNSPPAKPKKKVVEEETEKPKSKPKVNPLVDDWDDED